MTNDPSRRASLSDWFDQRITEAKANFNKALKRDDEDAPVHLAYADGYLDGLVSAQRAFDKLGDK